MWNTIGWPDPLRVDAGTRLPRHGADRAASGALASGRPAGTRRNGNGAPAQTVAASKPAPAGRPEPGK